MSDFAVSPFFSQNTLFVTNHGHGLCFHCGTKPFFLCNLKKKLIFLHQELLQSARFFLSVQMKKECYIPIEKKTLSLKIYILFFSVHNFPFWAKKQKVGQLKATKSSIPGTVKFLSIYIKRHHYFGPAKLTKVKKK